MQVHVVVEVCSGVAEGATVFFNPKTAEMEVARLKKEHGIVKGHEEESEDCVECLQAEVEAFTVSDCLDLIRNQAVDRADYAVDVWSIEDVIDRARESREPPLRVTKKQARAIIQALDRKKDATIGINWDTLDYWTDMVLNECPACKHPKCICTCVRED